LTEIIRNVIINKTNIRLLFVIMNKNRIIILFMYTKIMTIPKKMSIFSLFDCLISRSPCQTGAANKKKKGK